MGHVLNCSWKSISSCSGLLLWSSAWGLRPIKLFPRWLFAHQGYNGQIITHTRVFVRLYEAHCVEVGYCIWSSFRFLVGDMGVDSDVAAKSSPESSTRWRWMINRRRRRCFQNQSGMVAAMFVYIPEFARCSRTSSSLHMYGTETKKNSFTFASAGVWGRLLKGIVWVLGARKNLNSTKTVELTKTRADPYACATFLPVYPVLVVCCWKPTFFYSIKMEYIMPFVPESIKSLPVHMVYTYLCV